MTFSFDFKKCHFRPLNLQYTIDKIPDKISWTCSGVLSEDIWVVIGCILMLSAAKGKTRGDTNFGPTMIYKFENFR